MLTLEQYEALSEAEKAAVILKGNFLADREENSLMVQLYDVGRFYAEVSYDRAANRIIGFRVFEGTGRLIPYLAHIRFNSR